MNRILHSHVEDHIIIPDHIQRSLDRASGEDAAARMTASGVTWRDLLTPSRVVATDGAQVAATTTETIMCPDFTFQPDMLQQGDAFKYTLMGDLSTVITTPGTITFRLRWGGVGGTVLAASGAFAPDPTAAATTVSYCVEWFLAVRSVGAAGSMLAMGKIVWNDFDDASAATIVGNLNMSMAPVSAPAAVGSLDTTVSKALSPTVQFSVATAGTQLTNRIALLESLN